MTQIKFKNGIDISRLNILIYLINSWNVEAEVVKEDTTPLLENFASNIKGVLSDASFGGWADMNTDVCADIRASRNFKKREFAL